MQWNKASLIFYSSWMVLNASFSLSAKTLVPKPAQGQCGVAEGCVTKEGRKQGAMTEGGIVAWAVRLESARGGSLQQVGVAGCLFPDPLQEARKFRLKKILYPSSLGIVGFPGPSRGHSVHPL